MKVYIKKYMNIFKYMLIDNIHMVVLHNKYIYIYIFLFGIINN